MKYVNDVKQKAGFICLSNGMFSQAEALFKESECDPREVNDVTWQKSQFTNYYMTPIGDCVV